MTRPQTPFAPPAPSPYERWHRYFLFNRDSGSPLPWRGAPALRPAEIGIVARSMQQFQLGEWARGRGLRRRAAAYPALAADPWFLPALELFIAEEQRHSGILGRFLDREGIPRLKSHWVDGVFRRLRKLAGLEISAIVLSTAEVLAIPYYQALRDATRSPLLRAICIRILCDEAAHLEYQALTLGLIRRRAPGRSRQASALCHAALFGATAVLLWQQHRKVFRAAGWDFRAFWSDARRVFARLQWRIRQAAAGLPHGDSPDGLLD
jgi:hypothetical protein